MDPTTAEPPPGCLVILISLSASMNEDARVWLAHRYTSPTPSEDQEGVTAPEPEVRDLPKSVAARFLADELIDGLVNTLAAGYPVPLDVAVFGYGANEDGSLNLVPLIVGIESISPPLPDGKPAIRPVPLANVAELPVEYRSREGDPRKWTVPAACEGTAPAAAALAEMYKLVAIWLTGRYTARPPVVLHITGGEGLDEAYARVARSLGLLVTENGPTRLLHVGFATEVEPTLCGSWGKTAPEPWAGLFELAAELPAEPEGRPARLAVSVNDWSLADVWGALFDMAPTEHIVAWMQEGSERFDPASTHSMWAQKMGNTPEQWEDAYAAEPAAGVAAVADGASTGIYCRVWADRLARSFIAERPNVRDPMALGKWVHGLRGEWRAAIDYDKLNWSKKAKVDDVGAAATLLGLEVGPIGDDGNHPWRSFAVGDASLLWVRAGKLLATFPVVAADQFGSAPLLVRSNPGYKTLSLAAAGVCRPGDQFILATDAVAARLLRSAANGPGPDWASFETIDEIAWREELDILRKANDMVNDDCTLVTLRVAGGPPVEAMQAPSVLEGSGSEADSAPPLTSPLEGEGGEPEASRVGGEDQWAVEVTPHPPHPEGEATSPSRGEVSKLDVAEELPEDRVTPRPEQPTPDSGIPAREENDQRNPARDGFSDSTDYTV